MADEPTTFTFKIHDKLYKIDVGQFTGTEARAFRREVGLSFAIALEGIALGRVDLLEAVAGFKWIIDRRHKRDLSYDDVLETLTFDSVELSPEEAEEVDPPQGRPSSLASPPSPPSMGSDLGKLTNSASLS
jgi:hypothetical protein